MLVTVNKLGGVYFPLLCTNCFHVRAENERFSGAGSSCRQNLKYENFTSSYGRLRQNIAPKRVPQVQHDYFSSFNQANNWFVALPLPLPLPSSNLKLSISLIKTDTKFKWSRFVLSISSLSTLSRPVARKTKTRLRVHRLQVVSESMRDRSAGEILAQVWDSEDTERKGGADHLRVRVNFTGLSLADWRLLAV